MFKRILTISLLLVFTSKPETTTAPKNFLDQVQEMYGKQFSVYLLEKHIIAPVTNPFVYILKPKELEAFTITNAEQAVIALGLSKHPQPSFEPIIDMFFLK